MTEPVFFTLEGDFRGFVQDAAGDGNYQPENVAISATVTITPLLNGIVRATSASPRPISYLAAPTVAIVDPADGRLKIRSAGEAGNPDGFSFTPVRLLANSAYLELDPATPLFYRLTFTSVTFGGVRGSIASWDFEAPSADVTINVVESAPQTGAIANGLTKIAPGGVRMDGTDLVFSFGGVDIPDPVSLAGFTGPTGATGTAATVSVGTVSTGNAGSSATVTNTGTSSAAVLDFSIPRGNTGATGSTGAAATIAVGTVTTGNAGSSASVTNVGTSGAATFNFTIPKGDTGATGATGSTGAAATVALGTVTTGAAGSSASATNTGNSGAAVFNFTIPRGDPGEVTLAGVQTLTNKTLTSPTLTSPTFTGTITGAADATTVTSGKIIRGGVLSTQVEGGVGEHVTIPRLYNDLAYCTIRAGGAITMTKNGGAAVLTTDYLTPNGLFSNGGYSTFLLNTVSTDTWVFEVTIPTGVDLSYGAYYGISMTNGWRAKDVTIEVYYNGSWSTAITSTNQTLGDVWKLFSAGSYLPSKIRYTLTNFVTTQCRIISLYAVGASSQLSATGLLPRTGGALYGTNAAPPTLTATGADANISLNLVPKGTGTVQASGVPVVTTTGTQALTNKTLTSPTITAPTITTPNIDGGAGSGSIGTLSSATDANLNIYGKGLGAVVLQSGSNGVGFKALAPASSVNYLQAQGSASGSAIPLYAVSAVDTDISINLIPKGTGVVQANGVQVVTTTGAATLTNKTLTAPTITGPLVDTIKDSNGANALLIAATPSAVNYVAIVPAATGAYAQIRAQGSDAAQILSLTGSGTGGSVFITDYARSNAGIAQFYGLASAVNYWQFNNSATGAALPVKATGSDTDISINLVPKGAGVVQASGVQVDTISGVATLTNKTLTAPTLNNPTITNYTESVVAIGTVTSANTIALTSGTVQTATLTASTACTFTMPTATAGKSFVLLLNQAATTGAGTATFTGVKWGTAGAPTITATAGKMDILSFVSDGMNWYGSYSQGYTP